MESQAKIVKALNKQMGKEFSSAYNYLASAAYFEEQELPGFANFFHIQAKEELVHAMKIFEFIHRIGGDTELLPIPAPKAGFESALDAFEQGLKQEKELASEINSLLNLATDEHHSPARVFMFWFVNEQVEEEALFTRCIKRIKLVGKDGQGLLMLDKEFAERKADSAEGPDA
ncbi:MAG: ferritin [Planctomycetota bacterium]|nr:ferritin [Planctomycetota bacterium]